MNNVIKIKIKEMIDLKNKDAGGFFLLSASCYFLANNLHFIVSGGIFPRILDIVATTALFLGFFILFIERKGVNE